MSTLADLAKMTPEEFKRMLDLIKLKEEVGPLLEQLQSATNPNSEKEEKV